MPLSDVKQQVYTLDADHDEAARDYLEILTIYEVRSASHRHWSAVGSFASLATLCVRVRVRVCSRAHARVCVSVCVGWCYSNRPRELTSSRRTMRVESGARHSSRKSCGVRV